MEYMLLIYLDEKALSEQEREQCYEESAAYARALHGNGKFLAAGPLQPTSTATTVRSQAGKRIITDGPFAETREQLGGYFLIDAANLDEAIHIAEQIPAGRKGAIEIRPVLRISGIPAKSAHS